MELKELEEQIGFKEIPFPKIFGKNIRQFSATFDYNAPLTHPISSIYPKFSRGRLNEFLAGRICAIKALDGLVKRPEILPIGKNKIPTWPNGITGSITHTKNKVSAVALPSNLNLFLGLDLENIFIKKTAKELEWEILLESERRYLNLENYCAIITLIYSAKEAVFKAFNSIAFRFLDFKEIELTTLNINSNLFEARLINSEIEKIKGKFAFFDSMVLTGAEIEKFNI